MSDLAERVAAWRENRWPHGTHDRWPGLVTFVDALIADRERLRRISDAVDALEASAQATPEGTEDRHRGASVYNWLMHCVHWIRQHAAALEAAEKGESDGQ